MLANPLDLFKKQIDIFKAKFQGDASDWKLVCQYLLMPLLDVNSVRELVISKKKRNRLYEILRANSEAFSQLLRDVGYDCFFAEVEAFLEGDPSYQSRYRPHVIGDDTKQAKTTAKCMEYLTSLSSRTRGTVLSIHW